MLRIASAFCLVFLCGSAVYSQEHIRDAAGKGDLDGVEAAIARGEDKDSKSSKPFFMFASDSLQSFHYR